MVASTVDLELRRRRRFRTFVDNGGKFRVAVVNLCNLDCFFCHNEAMASPRRGPVGPARLSDDDLRAIVGAYAALGGRQVNITGGEPLAHPRIVELLESLDKRATRLVLNTNAVLAERLLAVPRLECLDGILASLHTTDPTVFAERLGGRSISRVMDNIVALRRHGYAVEVNFSLGPYNESAFDHVLEFVTHHGIDLKAIAFVRPNDDPAFYGGDWVDPESITARLGAAGATEVGSTDALGGRTTTHRIGDVTVKIKNVARGRLETDFCRGCPHAARCGEGIYGLRVGVDGLWKPCLLRSDRFRPVDRERPFEEQILSIVDEMIGRWDRARFRTGPPA